MNIQQIFFKNTLRNFAYLITFDDGQIYCIDPYSAQEIKALIKTTLKLTAIINTHDHCDHHSGNSELISEFQCPVLCHKDAMVPGKSKGLVNDELIHECNEWSLVSLNTPGHTLSHICLVLKKDKVAYALFTGDCFFNAGVGNCHNGGDPVLLYQTISQIFSLFPDDLLIYPGHEYLKRNLEFSQSIFGIDDSVDIYLKKISALNLDEIFFINSMKTERKINPFLNLKSLKVRKNLGMIKSQDQEVFICLRELRNKW